MQSTRIRRASCLFVTAPLPGWQGGRGPLACWPADAPDASDDVPHHHLVQDVLGGVGVRMELPVTFSAR